MEHIRRSVAKALSWRLFGFATTVFLVYFYSRDIKQALAVGVGLDGLKIVLYFVHERIWNRVGFGRRKPPEYQI
ncbi:MAG: DUF2061 domain-containing protein [Candidatus Omnitrophica bacterium]|nr:DUF2061 domain-containing protein [Candidatus Omnitrophota bacterium]MBU2043623.1 DUF2061 domain-containing protein [Candidatus Omnitrophota bacterium]MBU2265560.1 DUF2061 domain-containing protein [Candidatus Omnitrophota bacterium]